MHSFNAEEQVGRRLDGAEDHHVGQCAKGENDGSRKEERQVEVVSSDARSWPPLRLPASPLKPAPSALCPSNPQHSFFWLKPSTNPAAGKRVGQGWWSWVRGAHDRTTQQQRPPPRAARPPIDCKDDKGLDLGSPTSDSHSLELSVEPVLERAYALHDGPQVRIAGEDDKRGIGSCRLR